MKITIFELLGMVKDGKLMPERIKFENYIYIWRNTQKDYFCEQINHSLESIIGEYLFSNLNLEVEILEEKKIPEKLEILNANVHSKEVYYENYSKEEISLDIETLQNWVNKIVDYLDYLKSKGDE